MASFVGRVDKRVQNVRNVAQEDEGAEQVAEEERLEDVPLEVDDVLQVLVVEETQISFVGQFLQEIGRGASLRVFVSENAADVRVGDAHLLDLAQAEGLLAEFQCLLFRARVFLEEPGVEERGVVDLVVFALRQGRVDHVDVFHLLCLFEHLVQVDRESLVSDQI